MAKRYYWGICVTNIFCSTNIFFVVIFCQVTNYLLDTTRLYDDEQTYKASLDIEPKISRLSIVPQTGSSWIEMISFELFSMQINQHMWNAMWYCWQSWKIFDLFERTVLKKGTILFSKRALKCKIVQVEKTQKICYIV